MIEFAGVQRNGTAPVSYTCAHSRHKGPLGKAHIASSVAAQAQQPPFLAWAPKAAPRQARLAVSPAQQAANDVRTSSPGLRNQIPGKHIWHVLVFDAAPAAHSVGQLAQVEAVQQLDPFIRVEIRDRHVCRLGWQGHPSNYSVSKAVQQLDSFIRVEIRDRHVCRVVWAARCSEHTGCNVSEACHARVPRNISKACKSSSAPRHTHPSRPIRQVRRHVRALHVRESERNGMRGAEALGNLPERLSDMCTHCMYGSMPAGPLPNRA